MPRLLRALAAPRATIALMVSLGALLLAGLWIPQKAVLQRDLYLAWKASSPTLVRALELAGLTDIHRSPVAIAVWAGFFVNLVAAVLVRAPGILRRATLADRVPNPAELGGAHRRTLAGGGPDPLAAARAFFASRAYAIRDDQGRFRAVRNRLAPAATLLFHLSFVVILAGGTATVLTRFDGFVPLGEGEEFAGEIPQYEAPPRVAAYATWPSDRFVVDRIDPHSEQDVVVDVTVVLRDPDGAVHFVRINHPYDSPGGASYVFNNLGFAPVLRITTPDGRELAAGGFRLNVLSGRTDTLELLGRRMRTELFPDWYEEGGEDRTRSTELRNPVLRLSFETDTGRTVRTRVPLGGEVELGPYVVRFVDWRYWVRLYVRSERGVGVLFAGLALASLAVAWRLLLVRKDWIVAARDGGVDVAARSDYYRALFDDEFEATVAALAAALQAHAAPARAYTAGGAAP